MGKNVWVLHHYAEPPDGHWTGTYDLYKFLLEKGHKVTVFSSSFSHYTRQDTRLRSGEVFRIEEYNGMSFVFVKTAPHEKNDWRRILNMITYGLRAYRTGLQLAEAPDVVIGTNPHPFGVFAALMLARKKRAKFFIELHDLWLDYMIDTGMLSPRNPLAVCWRALDKYCYNNAEKIMVLWTDMDKYLDKFDIPAGKIVWVPLGVDFDIFKFQDSKEILDRDNRLIAICTARFGPASNIEEILQAAKILQDKGEDRIHFHLFGSGPEEDNLISYANESALKNVTFRGLVPKEEIPKHLNEADICIGGLPDIPCYNKYGTIPTKLIEYLSSGNPTVFITGIENNLVKRANAGFVTPPLNPGALAEVLLKISSMSPQERFLMGANGQKYVREHHNLRVLAEKMNELL